MTDSICEEKQHPPGYNALIQAIALFDNSQANLARALCGCGVKVSAMTISHWKVRGVPLDRCRDLEAVTRGQIDREEFRPDHFRVPADQSADDSDRVA